jgi:hypothetical protein
MNQFYRLNFELDYSSSPHLKLFYLQLCEHGLKNESLNMLIFKLIVFKTFRDLRFIRKTLLGK